MHINIHMCILQSRSGGQGVGGGRGGVEIGVPLAFGHIEKCGGPSLLYMSLLSPSGLMQKI